MLSDLAFKSVYKSDEDNILEEFYVPALSVATQYDRAVGFFSASTISYAGQALSTFVASGGKIRLILGAFTDKADIEAVHAHVARPAVHRHQKLDAVLDRRHRFGLHHQLY